MPVAVDLDEEIRATEYVLYVEELIGMRHRRDDARGDDRRHPRIMGRLAETPTRGIDEAKQALSQMGAVGVDYDDVKRRHIGRKEGRREIL